MEFKTNCKLLDYQETLLFMEKRVDNVILGREDELIWFVEHYPVISGGSSALKSDLLNEHALPIHYSGRGGKFTYHGPGQRIIYLILDLKKRAEPANPDLRSYVYNLEQVTINVLDIFGVKSQRIAGKVGIWVGGDLYPAKIAAIGIRVRKWVSYHGIAINLDPDLDNFKHIIPCGIKEYGVTSLTKLGVNYTKDEFDRILKQELVKIFG
jgi:lipoyl(octanoyl) transferase